MKMNSNPEIRTVTIDGVTYYQLVDSVKHPLDERRIQRLLDRYQSYFVDRGELLIDSEMNYVQLEELLEKLNAGLEKLGYPPVMVDRGIENYISNSKYAIREHQTAGLTIKDFDERWTPELTGFTEILDQEITRPLKPKQVQASFYLAKMKRAANFSVPGAGKTAMMYGAFAYLSSPQVNEVDRLLAVSPINAFEAWKTEFKEVFGTKRELHFMDLRTTRYKDPGKIRSDWSISNVVVINFEALKGRLSVLNELIDERTMIVFDEVHRVKGIGGQRAQAALDLGPSAQYHYVLTGTPIPNSYKDIYNFLHLLYDREYDSHFGWDVGELENPVPSVVNQKLAPFFWRTNKNDLQVPPADSDNIISVATNFDQKLVAETIYEHETSILSIYLRLLQASTNPALLTDRLNYSELGLLDSEVDLNQFTALTKEEKADVRKQAYLNLGVENMSSPKFDAGIELVLNLVHSGKKVLVWGMFVKTMIKIKKTLKAHDISVNLVYGATPKDDRVDLINEFRDGPVQVLISNPNTLGESISLHQSVHDAVYFEYNFNLTFMLQSRDRIHRLGLAPNQYTRYYYLMTEGDRAHQGFIDKKVYERLKEKEEVMARAIDGNFLVPEVTNDYLEDVKRIISG
ncbi:SNF2-related protein [Enterococcus sp. AZ149]|uniref:SNF2-related protein n=1 Tax=Enterococcus sp. AZ149 TaxID=2774686 RepID=UPI003F253B8A